MQQNLKENGGLLDEVVFLARTDNINDLEYLSQLVGTSKAYSRYNLTEGTQKAGKFSYGETWDKVVEKGTMYNKN